MLISTDSHIPNAHAFMHPSVLGLKGTAAELEYFVRQLPANETALVCCKLNLLFSDLMRKDTELVTQDALCRWLCEQGWLTIKDREKLLAHTQQRQGDYFFARQSLLELIRWLAIWGNRVGTFAYNDTKRQMAFARALLLSADFSTRNQTRLLTDKQLNDNDAKALYFHSLAVFRECSLLQVPPCAPMVSLGRFKELFVDCFLSRHRQYVAVLESELGMALDDYIACLVGLGSLMSSWSDRGIGFDLQKEFEFHKSNSGETTLMPDQLRRFIELEGQSIVEFGKRFEQSSKGPDSQLDLKVFRESPIFLTEDGRATFIDESFFMERATSGLLFRLVSKFGQKVLREFGYAFEDYSHAKLNSYAGALRENNINSNGYGPITASKGGQQYEFADYILIEGTTVVLFEMKAVWTPDGIVGGDDYWEQLMKRYGLSQTADGKEKKKGVAQLADKIKNWLDGSITIDSSAKLPSSISQIIPVLFVHDPHLSTLGHGRFLADEFARLLFDSKEVVSEEIMTYKGVSILNLCVMGIDEFEYFDRKILSKPFAALLAEYSARYKDRTISAGRFLANLNAEPNAPVPPMVIASDKVLAAASSKLFGQHL